jgi:hypothetical protein|tara:strand:- start:89 stop:262 length:174 start_codon:yes stop_codon:yes gene_type:complete
MVDILEDINSLEFAIIAFTEGASDEKRAALNCLEKLLSEKKATFANFESQAPADGDI